MKSATDIVTAAAELSIQLADELDRLAASGEPEETWGDDPMVAALLDTIEGVEGAAAIKLDRIRYVVQMIEAEAEAIAAEAARLTARAKSTKARASRVKERGLWLLRKMASAGQELKVRGTASHWIATTYRVEGPADIEAWPERLRRTKVVVEPDRIAAKKALEAGEAIDGLSLVPSQTWQSR